MILKYYELNKLNLDNNFILFHGKNEGLKNEEIQKLNARLKKKINSYDEKYIIENKEDFFESVLNGSLFDEGKTIVINKVSDKILSIVEELSEKKINDTFFILNSELLEKKSKLRNLFEKSKNDFISVAFYPDTNETLFKLASNFLNNQNISLSRENINLIINKCNNERNNLINELEKIKLYLMNKKKITNDEIIKLVNLTENHSINELINFCLAKNQKQTINILNDNNFSNEDCFLIIRTMLKKTKKLLNLLNQLNINKNIESTINNAKPPIFWKEKEIIKQQINNWKIDKIRGLIKEINETEMKLKKYSLNNVNFLSNFLLETSS
tara:strand:+ start:3222 stop:4202 length:981 start_codon:yes stop_codon:yes gene_type:complete